MSKKILLSICLISFAWFTSCSQNPTNYVEIRVQEEEPLVQSYSKPHDYGGWYCPDNIFGFPAVNVKKMDKIPIVNGRLPTKAETRNGTSLMFFDTTTLKNVKPLDMTMPKLARYYNEHTKKNEIIIVIQTAVIEKDTVVGFRYLNGGNGSAWFGEVVFMSETEIAALGSTPFITMEMKINASVNEVWNVMTNPVYTESLGSLFGQADFSQLKKNAKVDYKYAPEQGNSKGNVTISWQNTYTQIDYNFDGKHYVQKFYVVDNKDKTGSNLHIVSGPYGDDFEFQEKIWKDWLNKVKQLSEGI